MLSPKFRALVTGASSGIGEAFARRLARDGYDLVLVARRADRLQALAAELQTAHSIQAEVLVADLDDDAGIATVEARLTDPSLPPVTMLINNAGVGVYKPLAQTPRADVDTMLQLNVIALVRLTHAVLPGMLQRGSGIIINVSSGLAFATVATRAIYSATKAFVNHFTMILHAEVHEAGVQVQALCPAVTRTEFHDHSGTDLSKLPANVIMEAEDVVDASLVGLRLGEVVCIPAVQDADVLARYDAARDQVAQGLRNGTPAPRYQATV